MDAAQALNKKIAALMVERQSIAVDAVSGASVSTRAFAKAVENALSASVQK